VALEDGKPDPLRLIDFLNGGVDIVCPDSIDATGDINLNEIAYEVADAVLFSNYFVYGLDVFDDDPTRRQGQIAATDINNDGLTLSVADLVYLIRIITGDADPYPKEVAPIAANYIHDRAGVLSVSSDATIGAAFVTVSGQASPELLADNMEMMYNFDGTNTRVLVYSIAGEAFSGNMIRVAGDVVSIEMASYQGIPIAAKWVPADFALNQNYPNPFNPTTIISFDLPISADYDLTIYNVNGQKVQAFSGTHEAGRVEIEFDAANLASGVYFYKVNAGSFSATKKMVLLK
jgi:hypothetical protein